MSSTLVLVVAFGLFIGYWIVSKLLDASPAPRPQERTTNSETASKAAGPLAWHEVLQVSASASQEEIHAAYKTLIRQYHPDKVASLGPELKALAEEKSKAINAAYQEALRQSGG